MAGDIIPPGNAEARCSGQSRRLFLKHAAGAGLATMAPSALASTSGFTLTANPASLSVPRGLGGNTTVTAKISGTFKEAVSFSASSTPAGVIASFSPAQIAFPGSGSTVLTLDAGAAAAEGAHTIAITGKAANGVTEHAKVTVNVTAALPNLVKNGGFETGTFADWTYGPKTYLPVVSKARAHSGKHSALIGHLTEPEVDGQSYIYQTVKIPSSASKITLRFYYFPGSNDEFQYDQQEVLIQNAAGTKTLDKALFTLSNAQTWNLVVFDMTKLKGQTVRLYFAVAGNGYHDYTYMYIDDVSVTVG